MEPISPLCGGTDVRMPEDPATELELAHGALAEAEALRQQEAERGTVNRLYYACFHAARAVLYDRGFDPESHDTVIRWFGREIILEGDASDADGRFLRQLYTKRQNADYRQKKLVVNVDSLYARAEIFVDDMAELLNEVLDGDTKTDDKETERTDE
jgi:uncharacterized protein (UPF0332 family)